MVALMVGGVEEVGAAFQAFLTAAEVGVHGVGAHDPLRKLFVGHLTEAVEVCLGWLFQPEVLGGFFVHGGAVGVCGTDLAAGSGVGVYSF